MKKIGFLWLLVALVFGACQEENLGFSEPDSSHTLHKDILWKTKTVDGFSTKAVGVESKYWGPGDTISIKFLNGTTELQQKVQQYAAIWLDYASLVFKYVATTENADVKIGFDMDEKYIAWSTIGKDCEAVPQNEPSLNFAYLEYEDEVGIKAEVLRGFGQVLGLGLEHRNPDSPVRFKATADIVGEYGLSEAEIEEFKQLYTDAEVEHTGYDKGSIMMVTIPRTFVTVPTMATSRNTDLSDGDKEFIEKLYPRAIISVVAKKYIQFCADAEYNTSYIDPTRKVYLNKWWKFLPEPIYYTYGGNFDPDYMYRADFFASSDTAYREFICDYGVVSIDVTKCAALKYLYCRYCKDLAELDVSQNPELEILACNDGNISSLDVSNHVNLWGLTCANNPLEELNVTNCTELDHIVAYNCELGKLSLINVPNLKEIHIYGNPIGELVHLAEGFASQLPIRRVDTGFIWVGNKDVKEAISSICKQRGWFVNIIPSSLKSRMSVEMKNRGYVKTFSKEDLWMDFKRVKKDRFLYLKR